MNTAIFFGMILATYGFQTPEVEYQNAIRLHSSAVKSIHSIDAIFTAKAYGSKDEFKQPQQERILRWSMLGPKQRFRQKLKLNTAAGQADKNPADVFTDIFIDKGMLKTLEGWDPEAPPSITPINPNGVLGSIEPYAGHVPMPVLDPLHAINFAFTLIGGDASRSLDQIVQATPRGLKGEKVIVEGAEVIRLSIPYFTADSRQTNSYFLIDLDPAHHYLASRVEAVAVNEQIDGGPAVSFRNIMTVLEYGSFSDGLAMPTRLTNESFGEHSKTPDIRIELNVDVRAVNSPLPADSFEFRFPEYTVVRNLPPVNGRVKASIWGADDQPIQEIKNQADLIEIAKRRGFPIDSLHAKNDTSGVRFLVIVFGVGILIITLLLWWRSRSAHRRNG